MMYLIKNITEIYLGDPVFSTDDLLTLQGGEDPADEIHGLLYQS